DRGLGPIEILWIRGGGAQDRIWLAQVRLCVRIGSGLHPRLVARLQPAQRLRLDRMTEVRTVRCEQGDTDDQQTEKREGVVPHLQQAVACVTQKDAARAGDRS